MRARSVMAGARGAAWLAAGSLAAGSLAAGFLAAGFLAAGSLAAGFLAAGCRPEAGDRASLVTETRVLSVRGEPPESLPGEEVHYDLLVASPDGTVVEAAARWAFCAAAPPLADNRPVSDACLGDGAVRPIGGPAASVTAVTPVDACSLFGPEVADSTLRPRDADVTGGYYQPVRVEAAGEVAFGMERVHCDLPDAPVDAVKEYVARYVMNRNPGVAALTAESGGVPADLSAVRPGEVLTFRVEWEEGDAEVYPVFDRPSQAVVDRREALRVSWFVTGGVLLHDRTGRGEAEPETFSDDEWSAPGEAGRYYLWAVLRDSRGGAAHASAVIDVVR